MKIIEAIGRVDELKPNTYDVEHKIGWLSKLDLMIQSNVFNTHEGAPEKVFEGYSDAKYLGTVLVEEGIVEDNQSDYGLYILVADGEEASWEKDQAYWSVYVGDEPAVTGADQIVLEDGGVYSVVYTIG